MAIVRGTPNKGERPYVKIGRWRYTNPRIAADYSLIGSTLKCYCSIRDVRVVHAINLHSGEDLGRLLPPARWRDTYMSFRMRALTYRTGEPMRRHERRDMQAHEWLAPASRTSSKPRKAARDIPSKDDALASAKHELNKVAQVQAEAPPAQTPTSGQFEQSTSSNTRKGLFNLDGPTLIDKMHRKE